MRFAIELDGRLIGGAGYYRRRSGTAELGFWLGRDWWGRGYATEANRAVLRYGFEVRRLPGFTSSHFVDNHASAGVLRKLGFEPIGRGRIICAARGYEVEAVTYWLPASPLRSRSRWPRRRRLPDAGAPGWRGSPAGRPEPGLSRCTPGAAARRRFLCPACLISWSDHDRRDATTIRTERLLLRPLRPNDAEPLFALFANWEVVRWLSTPPWPYALDDARAFVAAQVDVGRAGSSYFAITLDGALIGGVGRAQPLTPQEHPRGLRSWAIGSVSPTGVAAT